MDEESQKELQLLPSQSPFYYHPSSSGPARMSNHHHQPPSLDLKLSIRPMMIHGGGGAVAESVESLKWEAAEEIRLAAVEKAYAERVRELTRREMELAQSEFTRARLMWQRARTEVDKAEMLKERATSSSCMEVEEITCHSCRQRFIP